ncbi:SGNH/GDSL hydrolase family protein [Myceligenerans xiligouense]|uniref:SGNH/GDSL hydrolase family protein n=1 Tax=Myceligenerans xiligouense TaxID=253184 RepID=UPI00319DCD12
MSATSSQNPEGSHDSTPAPPVSDPAAADAAASSADPVTSPTDPAVSSGSPAPQPAATRPVSSRPRATGHGPAEPPAEPAAASSGSATRSDEAPRWQRYVAIGDSFTEGLWDPYPGLEDTQRGWADRLATSLSERRIAAGEPAIEYANLAIRGRLLRPIIAEQLDAALSVKPDLVSLIGGGNDILRPGVDLETICAALEHAVARIRATGADVLLGTGFKAGGTLAWTNSRVGVYNANLWSIARRHDAHVLDLWGIRSLFDLRMWSSDRIHLLPEGHERVKNAALAGLGLSPDDPDWDEPLPPAPRQTLVAATREHAAWAREHVGPWVKRRVTGRSSGDGRTPKWPAAEPWPRA